MPEADSRTSNQPEVFLGLQPEYLNIVCRVECSHPPRKKLVCYLQNFHPLQPICA